MRVNIRRVLRYILEVNSASFPFVVTGAVAFAFMSFLAPAWVHEVFGASARRLWVFFGVSIGAEVGGRITVRSRRVFRDISSDVRIGIASARDVSRVVSATAGHRMLASMRVTWDTARMVAAVLGRTALRYVVGTTSFLRTSRVAAASVHARAVSRSRLIVRFVWAVAKIIVRIAFRIIAVAVVIFLRIVRTIAVAVFHTVRVIGKIVVVSVRVFIRMAPHALPFALVVLLVESSPVLPAALRMSANTLIAYLVACMVIAAIAVFRFSRTSRDDRTGLRYTGGMNRRNGADEKLSTARPFGSTV